MRLRIVTSTSAAARLGEAARFLQRQPPASEVLVVGASRGAADDLARAVGAVPRRDLRPLAFRLRRARGPPCGGTGRGRQARPRHAGGRGGGGGACRVRRRRRPASSPTSGRSRRCRDSRRRWRGRFTSCGWLVWRPSVCRPAMPLRRTSGVCSTAWKRSSPAGRSTTGARCSTSPSERASGRVASRWVGLPIVLLDVTLDSRAESEFLLALLARALPTRSPRFLTATSVPVSRSSGSARAVETGDGRRRRPRATLAHLRRYVFTSGRPPVRARAWRRAAVLRAGRRTRGDRNRPSCPRRGGRGRALRRDGGLPACAAAVPRPARARLCARRRPRVLRSRHAAARSGRPCVRRAALVRRRGTVGEAVRRVPVARSGAADRVGRDRTARDPAPPRDEVLRRRSMPRSWTRKILSPEAARSAPPVDSDDDAIVAGTLRSPWKWEELIVESAVVGGRDAAGRQGALAPAARRPGRRLSVPARGAEARRARVAANRAFRARSAETSTHLRGFALPIVDELADWPERGDLGRVARAFFGAGRARARRPARVLQMLADLRPMAEIGQVTLEEARDVLHDRLVTLDWEPPRPPLRPTLRRHPASGARPDVPRGLRAGAGRARRAAASA